MAARLPAAAAAMGGRWPSGPIVGDGGIRQDRESMGMVPHVKVKYITEDVRANALAVKHREMEQAPTNDLSPQVRSQSNANYVDYSAATCIPIIIIFAMLRIYGKLFILKKTWDDLACLFGVAVGLVYIALGMTLVHSGHAFGRHQLKDLQLPPNVLRLSSVYHSMYGPAIWFVKLTVFVLYIEIFGRIRWLKICAYVGAIVTGLIYFSTLIVFLLFCSPFVTQFSNQRCLGVQLFLVSVGIVNFLSDLYLMILPLPAVWRLQLPTRKKIGISVLFLTGLIAVTASVLSFYFRTRFYLHNDGDVTWATIQTIVMANIELTAGIAVACMPTAAVVCNHAKSPIRMLLSTSGRRLLSLTSRSKKTSNSKETVLKTIDMGHDIDYDKPLPLPPNARLARVNPFFKEMDHRGGLNRNKCVGLNWMMLDRNFSMEYQRCSCGGPGHDRDKR